MENVSHKARYEIYWSEIFGIREAEGWQNGTVCGFQVWMKYRWFYRRYLDAILSHIVPASFGADKVSDDTSA